MKRLDIVVLNFHLIIADFDKIDLWVSFTMNCICSLLTMIGRLQLYIRLLVKYLLHFLLSTIYNTLYKCRNRVQSLRRFKIHGWFKHTSILAICIVLSLSLDHNLRCWNPSWSACLLDCVLWNFEFQKLDIALSCPKSWFWRVVISIFARDWVSDLRYSVRECL